MDDNERELLLKLRDELDKEARKHTFNPNEEDGILVKKCIIELDVSGL